MQAVNWVTKATYGFNLFVGRDLFHKEIIGPFGKPSVSASLNAKANKLSVDMMSVGICTFQSAVHDMYSGIGPVWE